jgi:hypothetical protein
MIVLDPRLDAQRSWRGLFLLSEDPVAYNVRALQFDDGESKYATGYFDALVPGEVSNNSFKPKPLRGSA